MGSGTRSPIGVAYARLFATLTLAVVATLAVSAVDGASAAPAQASSAFSFNFDGTPSTPQPWTPTNWDVVVHSRNVNTFAHLEGMQAQHGANCSPYPGTHYNDSYEGAVFICHNHVMTAIKAGGYGEIVLTPDHMVDFSAGPATISFDLSTLRTSDRDWAAIWITPFDDNLVLPIEPSIRVDLQGPPKRGLMIRMDQGAGGTIFRAELMDQYTGTRLPVNLSKSLEKLVSASAVQRTKFSLTISSTHLKFGAPDLGYNWVDAAIPGGLSFTHAVVQLAHHSYNPTKCHPTATLICDADTWHWSNFYISNAVPFTLLRGDQQVLHPASSGLNVAATPTVVSFPSPAPASAFLRFAAIGAIDFSLDGGKTWLAAQRQHQVYSAIDHFSSYFTPIPAGTTRVTFRGHNWGFSSNPGNPWWIRDISIWSTSAPGSAPNQAPASGQPSHVNPAAATHAAFSLAAHVSPLGLTAGGAGLLVLAGIATAFWSVRRRRRARSRNS